ncbi:hypothetical protein BJ508DRAFT_332470 [Ascobolus immersus RN42]|uniref:Uncharacterized protein n=1 Tax=Ascobolus immersus RN42 TaxID=1160509 RepID=A0A3N4HRH4_ASCIM|nr:hypothetical protein BJ508DRAFT_332470 [Ascobolus immersus RN42]
MPPPESAEPSPQRLEDRLEYYRVYCRSDLERDIIKGRIAAIQPFSRIVDFADESLVWGRFLQLKYIDTLIDGIDDSWSVVRQPPPPESQKSNSGAIDLTCSGQDSLCEASANLSALTDKKARKFTLLSEKIGACLVERAAFPQNYPDFPLPPLGSREWSRPLDERHNMELSLSFLSRKRKSQLVLIGVSLELVLETSREMHRILKYWDSWRDPDNYGMDMFISCVNTFIKTWERLEKESVRRMKLLDFFYRMRMPDTEERIVRYLIEKDESPSAIRLQQYWARGWNMEGNHDLMNLGN